MNITDKTTVTLSRSGFPRWPRCRWTVKLNPLLPGIHPCIVNAFHDKTGIKHFWGDICSENRVLSSSYVFLSWLLQSASCVWGCGPPDGRVLSPLVRCPELCVQRPPDGAHLPQRYIQCDRRRQHQQQAVYPYFRARAGQSRRYQRCVTFVGIWWPNNKIILILTLIWLLQKSACN